MVWMASRRGGRCQGPAGPNRASPNRASETHGKPGQAPAVQRFFQRKNELAFSRVTSAVPTSMRFSTGCPRAALMASSMLRLPMVSGY